MGDISIIIVSWNARTHLRNCLNSIRDQGAPVVREVIVVDNASTDGSPEMVAAEFPEVNLIQTGKNLGFAKANNVGIRQAKGTLLALINSDVLIHAGCLQKLADFLDDNAQAGLVGPKVTGGDGLLQLTCGCLPNIRNTLCEFLLLHQIFPRSRWFSGFQLRELAYARPEAVEVLSGCFWLARRDAVEKVGGLDERFFFYAEDIDWCKRFSDGGWKIFLVPVANATHFGGGSSANAPLRYSIEILRANLLYWNIHHGRWGQAAFYSLALVQHGFRLIFRGLSALFQLGRDKATLGKFRQHLICIRWLLTGKGV
ncbi:MAG: glycosyltransferase family 2 protein [Cytophagales bacterium]|nr:glycosyltransferase family 2 protein [Cytophagales bacterium]